MADDDRQPPQAYDTVAPAGVGAPPAIKCPQGPSKKFWIQVQIHAHYIVAFKNPRDQLGVRNVMLQSFPTTWKDTLETFHQATTRPYGYLVLDLHPASSDQQRLLSHLLKDERWTRTYQKRL